MDRLTARRSAMLRMSKAEASTTLSDDDWEMWLSVRGGPSCGPALLALAVMILAVAAILAGSAFLGASNLVAWLLTPAAPAFTWPIIV